MPVDYWFACEADLPRPGSETFSAVNSLRTIILKLKGATNSVYDFRYQPRIEP
jgi:hypothetical protein